MGCEGWQIRAAEEKVVRTGSVRRRESKVNRTRKVPKERREKKTHCPHEQRPRQQTKVSVSKVSLKKEVGGVGVGVLNVSGVNDQLSMCVWV